MQGYRGAARQAATFAAVVAAMAAAFSGCGSDVAPAATGGGGGGGGLAKPALTATGGFQVALDGKTFAIDYSQGEVEVDIVHKLNPDPKGHGCVTSVRMALKKKDGSCQLLLRFEPVGESLRLVEGQFAAALGIRQGGVVVDTLKCAGFPGADAAGEILWAWKGGNAQMTRFTIGPPEASKEKATIANANFTPTGTIDLAHKGKQFSLDVGAIDVQGVATSIGSATVSCGVTQGAEVCPKDAAYGDKVDQYLRRPGGAYSCVDSAAFDFGDFCGKPHVVIVYDHWLASPQRNPDGHDKFGGKAVLEGLAGLLEKYGKEISIALVVRTGSSRVVIENPAKPGTYSASGPAPTLDDCAEIRTKYGIPEDVVVLYDKDKALNSTDKRLFDVSFVPQVGVMDGKGQIRSILPGPDGKLELPAVEAAIEDALSGK